MAKYFDTLFGINIPSWLYIAAPVALFLLLLFIIWYIKTRIFKARLRRIINTRQDEQQHKEAIRKFGLHYSPEKLIRYSKRMERYTRKMGPQVVLETGLADRWVQKLTHSALPVSADLLRVLLYCPACSLFKAFIRAGQYSRLQKVFINWMHKEGDEKVIRLLAGSCRGEEFDPSFGRMFLENNAALLKELTGEPEWFARYFAYRILLLDQENLTERDMESGLLDPHPLIRKILTEKFSFGPDKTWEVLWEKLIHDPVFEVREVARKRIANEFMDRYNLKDVTLDNNESARVLELLDPDCQEDKNFALLSLESSNKEICFPAAFFLDKCGVFTSLLEKNTLDDPGTIEHSVSILQKALKVNVSGFLKNYSSGDGAPLLVVARLLSSIGSPQENVCYLEKKVFDFFNNKKLEPSNIEIYKKTLEAVANSGDSKSLEIFVEELLRREKDKAFLDVILPKIPRKAEALFVPNLFRFLEDINFPSRDELLKVLGTFSPDIIFSKVFQILNGSRVVHPHVVRISALKILGALRCPFCLLRILESLPTLTLDEAEEFARLIANYPKEVFEEKVKLLLESPDAKVRASLITILPITENEKFLKQISASLKDVDPDVRVAAIKALLGFGEIKLLNQETSMLHDPIERVRVTTAEVIAKHGNAAAMEILKNIVSDPGEIDAVKISVINGLGDSSNPEGIKILVSVLDSFVELSEYVVKALAMRVARRDITQLVEIFRDAEPQLREKLIPVFKAQGKKAEPQIIEMLKSEVASLKPYLVKILEETGFVDETKRQLLNKDAKIRREAAMFLSLLETLPAFRGLVLAAKDPDEEVRVCVVKALEKLKSSHSQEVLENLKNDPDSRVRKYTYWALERLDSLSQ